MLKRLLCTLAVLTLLMGVIPAAVAEETVTFSYWIPRNEDTSYYDNYRQNPVIQYLLGTRTYEGKKLELEFKAGIPGSERDNFSNMLSTESLTDVFNLAYCDYTPETLLKDDYILDLTEWIPKYMPNYMAALEKSPELKAYVTNDGKYLALYGIREKAQSNFMGILYRRDWIAKYGQNPVTGAPFTYGFGEAKNAQTWTDDVVFPSGGTEPIYISDWEWMFDIFTKAVEDLGISDGYCFAPYFKGYNEDGTLYSGFGGGTPMWYRTSDNHAAFGGGSNNLRAYLACMNTWYKKGYLDPSFAERTSDQVYSINSAGVHTGKVGLWIGRNSEVGTQLDAGDAWTSGIMVMGARQPINDIYGGEAQKGKEPDSMYQMSRLSQPIAVSNKVTEEELPTVLSFLDSFYTEEGGILLAIGMNAEQAAQIISEMRPTAPLTLVFDNFQFALNNWQPQVLDALAKCVDTGLCTVFISQNFGRLREVLFALEGSICYIRSRDLLLSKNDIGAYARQLGISASAEEIRSIYRKTDGWTAAVALYLENLREKLPRGGADGLDELLGGSFWQKLTAVQKETLLRLCLFDRLSENMLRTLLPEGLLPPEEQIQLFHRAPLMLYREDRKTYYPHELLSGFLRRRLEECDGTFQREVLRASAEIFRKTGQPREAVSCYYRAKDYESILSCELVCLITEKFDGISYTELAHTVLTECPAKIQVRYPYSLLRLCYALYAGCAFDVFHAQMQRVYALLESLDDPQLLGEWHLLNALDFFPDLDAMKAQYEEAEMLMNAPSKLFVKEEPFLFGCASMWYLFYSEPGTMLQTADKLAEAIKIYNRLTNGHGAGAAEIYRGEAYSVQGRFEESDIQAYQAAFLSEQSGNATATYGAALLLGINAIYRSDMAGLQKAIDYLENKAQGYAFLRGRTLGTYMVETVRGYLLGLMMETGRSALWTQGEADSSVASI